MEEVLAPFLQQFQSAFRWIWVGRVKISYSDLDYGSFNPLFAGYGLEGTSTLGFTDDAISFNPLFAGYGLEEIGYLI